MNYEKFCWGAVLLAAALALPSYAWAQDEEDEGGASADSSTGSSAEVSADILGGSPLAADTEAPVASAPEEEKAEEKAPAEPAKSSPVTGTWTKKIEFASEDGNFKFQPLGFVQPKLQLLILPDADDALAGSGFVLHRARFGFKAALFKFARLETVGDFKTGSFGLVDYFIDVDPWDGLVAFRVGRFRPWFGRQFMASSTQLQMIENAQAWADKDFGLGLDRDLGVGVFGLIKDTFEYGLGVWNGDGGSLFDNKARELGTDADGNTITAPGNIDVMVGGRLAFHPLAPFGVGRALPLGNESDSDISEKPGLAVGVSAYYNKRHDRVIEIGAGDALYYDNQFKLGADVAFQMIGLSVAGEFYMMKVWLPDDADDTVAEALHDAAGSGVATIDNIGLGMYFQVGYFVMPKKLEIAARFDMVDPNEAIRGSRMYPGLGATWHFFGNNLKAQLLYRLDVGVGYEDADPGHMDTGHDLFLMLQASI